MITCTHRRATDKPRLFVCSNPNVNTPSNIVWRGVCAICPHADNGVQTVEPKRIGDERRGFGDLVSDWIRAVGFRRKQKCGGCTNRQRLLNRLLPFRRGEVVEVVELDPQHAASRDADGARGSTVVKR